MGHAVRGSWLHHAFGVLSLLNILIGVTAPEAWPNLLIGVFGLIMELLFPPRPPSPPTKEP